MVKELPKSISDWYVLGHRLLSKICDEAGCEPSESKCASCSVGKRFADLDWILSMGWRRYMEMKVFSLKDHYKEFLRMAKQQKVEQA